jgi:hypothetical protein
MAGTLLHVAPRSACRLGGTLWRQFLFKGGEQLEGPVAGLELDQEVGKCWWEEASSSLLHKTWQFYCSFWHPQMSLGLIA